uniref:Tuftelin n=1 Tax=Lygus hesperus TaxID=30085 RepID=A0A0A9XV38_LYGHE
MHADNHTSAGPSTLPLAQNIYDTNDRWYNMDATTVTNTPMNTQPQYTVSDTLPFTHRQLYGIQNPKGHSNTYGNFVPMDHINTDTDRSTLFQDFTSTTYQPTKRLTYEMYNSLPPIPVTSSTLTQQPLPSQSQQQQRYLETVDTTAQLHNRIRELEWQLLTKDDLIQQLETKLELQQQKYEIRAQQLRNRAIDAVKRMQMEAKKFVQEKNRVIEELRQEVAYLDTQNLHHRKTSHLTSLHHDIDTGARNEVRHLRSINEELQDQLTTVKRSQYLLQEKVEQSEHQNDILYTTLENLQQEMQQIVSVYWLLTKMEVLPSHRGENLMRCRIINTTHKRQIEFDVRVDTVNTLTNESHVLPFPALLQTALPSREVASNIHINYIPRKIFSQYNDIPALYSDPFFFRASDSTTF